MPQIVPGAAPVRKTSPLVWVLVVVLAFFVLGGLALVGLTGLVLHKARQAGVGFDRTRDGGVTITARGADGKNATVEFGTSVGKLPSWVPSYPGMNARATFTVKGSGEGEGANFTFTTSDSPSEVLAFYRDKCKDLGLKVDITAGTWDGGTMVAADEAERRSLTVIAGGGSRRTTVNVTYASK